MTKVIDNALYISEIFESISGEVGGFLQGEQCTFVRFAGCNLKCDYCDAKETQSVSQTQLMPLLILFEKIEALNNESVVLTGGEPFFQFKKALSIFIDLLVESNYKVSIETNGTYRIPPAILATSIIVMDYKLNFIEKMENSYFLDLKSTDFIKFVITNSISMAIALEIQKELIDKGCIARFAYSPMLPDQNWVSSAFLMAELKEKAGIILKGLNDCNLSGILNIQIHKLIDQP